MKIVSEEEFRELLQALLYSEIPNTARSVSGPGRSGAIASVYTSHILRIPFIPYRQTVPEKLRPHLVIDTAALTGATIRKAAKQMETDLSLVVFHEPPRVKFWYEL